MIVDDEEISLFSLKSHLLQRAMMSSASPMAQPLSGTLDSPDTTPVDFQITLSPEELSLKSITGKILEMTLQRRGGNDSHAAALFKVNRKVFCRLPALSPDITRLKKFLAL